MNTATKPVTDAICACGDGTEAAFLFHLVPDRGELEVRSDEYDERTERTNACLAARLSGTECPAFHFGTDVIRTPPRRLRPLSWQSARRRASSRQRGSSRRLWLHPLPHHRESAFAPMTASP